MADIELTVKQVAADLRTSERNVRRWLAQGRLRGRREVRGNLGYTWRIDADSVRRVATEEPTDTAPADIIHGNEADTLSAAQVAALADEVRSLREEGAEYRQVIELQAKAISGLAWEVKGLTDEVSQMQRLLGPAPEEVRARPRWWERLVRRGG